MANSAIQRRVSPRLQNVPEENRPFYGSSPNRKRTSDEPPENDAAENKKPKVEKKPPAAAAPVKKSNPKPKPKPEPEPKRIEEEEEEEIGAQDGEVVSKAKLGISYFAPNGPLTDENGVSYAARVRETLRVFNLHYLHFVQEEEKRCNKQVKDNACCDESDDLKEPPERPKPKKKSEKGSQGDGDETKNTSKRPDLKAISKMQSSNEFLHPERRFGNLPGIEVGHQFFSRAEMVALGFHAHWLNGIDYIGQSKGKKKYEGYTLPLAVAIVMSGQYEDDLDDYEEVVYTGQGGNDLLGNKKQIKDQVLKRGNLALKNNMDQCVPVRVVRGHKCVNSYTKKVYTYDGLYEVVNFWSEKGAAGFNVFQYRLKRLPGQPELCSKQVHFTRGGSKVQPELAGLVCKDISYGQENVPIPVTNVIDVPPVAPEGLTYMKTIKVAQDVNLPPSAPGCSCKGNCTDPDTCACAKLNGSDFPYVARDGGRLVEAKAVVFECGPNCGCGPSCVNRTSQRGLKYRLEVYRTPDKGWAVRSWDFIPSGAPVCEYIGVLRKTNDVDSILGNEFIFEIDCWHTMNGIGSREKRMCDVSIPNSNSETGFSKLSESEPEFCVDAYSHGNFARYINHSCEPNLFVQCVLSDHHDVRLARIVLFAADNIPPLQELSYDYGYELNSVVGPDGKIKQLACCCGTADCRKRLY